MNKRYLQPGETVSLNFFGRVGPSGTLVDMQPDVSAMVANSGGNTPGVRCGDSIGSIVRGGDTSDVFVDVETGRLWHNDDDGWY